MTRYIITIIASTAILGLGWEAAAAPVHTAMDPDVSNDSRIREFTYDPNDVYTLPTRVGYASYVEFAPHEEVDTISVGERSFWQIIPSGNRLFIRPMKNDVSTNMTVITNKHAYQFDLKSSAEAKEKIIYVARFAYPEMNTAQISREASIINPFMPQPPVMPPHAPASVPPPPPVTTVESLPPPPLAAPAPLQPLVETPLPPPPPSEPPPVALTEPEPVPVHRLEVSQHEGRNYNYTLSGSNDAAPYEVYDNGTTTYFRYQPPALTPPLAGVVDADGKETAVTVYQNGGYFAVDTVAPTLALHFGNDGTTYIFNETLAKH